jgi:hypothetical protein
VKISAIRVFRVDLPLVEGRYSWSEGKYVEVFDSTVVELYPDSARSARLVLSTCQLSEPGHGPV